MVKNKLPFRQEVKAQHFDCCIFTLVRIQQGQLWVVATTHYSMFLAIYMESTSVGPRRMTVKARIRMRKVLQKKKRRR